MRHIAQINKFPRKHIGVRQHPSESSESSCGSRTRKGLHCLVLNHYAWVAARVLTWATVTWMLSWAGGFASKLAHSPGFVGRPQYLTSWASPQVERQLAFLRASDPREGGGSLHTWYNLVTHCPVRHVWSLETDAKSCTLSGEDLGSNIWREECGRRCGLA